MRYLSLCSGIEAASVAWAPLGWKCIGVSEVDPFASAVLAHHYPDVQNYGDLTKWRDWSLSEFDLLVGGTPCQSFSIAGDRGGLEDERGQLTLEFFDLLNEHRPRWFVWENVPGLLSNGGGDSFAAVINKMGQCGFHVGWRVLDTQYVRVDGFRRAVPQRRRRVIAVGHRDTPECAAKVLFERESLRRDTPPRRGTGQGDPAVAGSLLASGAGTERPAGVASETDFLVWGQLRDVYDLGMEARRDQNIVGQDNVAYTLAAERQRNAIFDVIAPEVSATLVSRARGGGFPGAQGNELGYYVAQAFGGGRTTGGPLDVAATLTAKGQRLDFEVETFLCQIQAEGADTLTARGFEKIRPARAGTATILTG